jgi:uncharacterized LabA/DUF88 family protein
LRAVIFIDGAYLQTQLKNSNLEADYLHLSDHLLAPLRNSLPLDLLRCYYYYCPPYMSQEPTEDELKRMDVHDSFVAELQSLGRWAVRLGKLQKRWEGQREVYEQKRVDVLLSVDMVRHAAAGHIQHAVLVAGDSDFVPAVEAAKEHGVTVSLWCGQAKTVHKDLIALADEVYAFDWKTFPLVRHNSSEQRPRNPRAAQSSATPSATDEREEGQRASRGRRRRGSRGRGSSAAASEPGSDSSSEEPKKGVLSRIRNLTGKKDG